MEVSSVLLHLLSHVHSLDKNRPAITISDSTLEYVNVSKLLGVHFHQHLNWDEHVQATCKSCYLTLINRAGSLYGRILTEVASTDRMQGGLYRRPRSRFSHTDRPSSVNKMFIIWPKKKAKEQKHK